MSKKEELSLEESFEQLDELMERLETPDITLEESFDAYQQGMKLLKECNDKIDQVEKKVLALQENGETDEF